MIRIVSVFKRDVFPSTKSLLKFSVSEVSIFVGTLPICTASPRREPIWI